MSVEPLVVASKVKTIIKDSGCQTSSDAIDELNRQVRHMLERAVARAKDNKRSTVKPQDI
ncbi:MAG: hypothetical protein AAF533_28635 [Acidobacteriota bacterium]